MKRKKVLQKSHPGTLLKIGTHGKKRGEKQLGQQETRDQICSVCVDCYEIVIDTRINEKRKRIK